MIKIKRGLDIPICGEPTQVINSGPTIRTVALVGNDYHGMKPTMKVKEGDKVKKGQVLFTDKKTEGVQFTAPAGGTIAAINRGPKRVLQSVVIDVDLDGEESVEFKKYGAAELQNLSRDDAETNLLESGLWTALRTRPFSKVPAPGTQPSSIFVTAMDTNPLAADPALVVAGREEDFVNGITVLSRLTSGKVYVCKAPGSEIPAGSGTEEIFAGPHPAGLPGTHIHFLDPVSANKTVWYINYQDVMAVGALFTTGELDVSRVLSLAGPQVEAPVLFKSRIGASTEEICAGKLKPGENRVISGSPLHGNIARGPYAFLSRYALQVTAILEGKQREFMRYLSPGLESHSVMNIYLSKLFPGKKVAYTTNTMGSERAMVPIGAYEEVMPLDILPTHLLRSLLVGDSDMAQQLGCLELDEEDLALCTYACAGKYEYGPVLRENLTRIELEG